MGEKTIIKHVQHVYNKACPAFMHVQHKSCCKLNFLNFKYKYFKHISQLTGTFNGSSYKKNYGKVLF